VVIDRLIEAQRKRERVPIHELCYRWDMLDQAHRERRVRTS
jgi:hypothetical protein